MHKKRMTIIFSFIVIVVLGVIILSLPPVWSRVSYHLQEIYTNIKYKLSPPENVIFVPGQSTPDNIATSVQGTLSALNPPTLQPTATQAGPTPMPTSTPIPLSSSAFLKGIKQEEQEFNNCAPTTLSMYLSYWKWSGNQDSIAPIVKPNPADKNVMPYELQDYVVNNTDFQAIVRVGGDLQTLKALVNAGIPVMVEKGFYIPSTAAHPNLGWMGHYELVIGYDDEAKVFRTHDSYLPLIVGKAEAKDVNFTYNSSLKTYDIPYTDFYQNWREFNYVFLVVYPLEKQNDVMNLLGPLWDEPSAFQIAHDRALPETTSLTDPFDQFFAWFNLGSSLVKQLDYSGAASTFDQAYILYPSIDELHRPWRMIWYQTGPYYAYYYSGRYTDVIDLATTTLDTMAEPILEESYYWRGLAESQLGYQDSAITDLRKSLEVHSGFGPSLAVLQQMGVTP
ncbi:MAG: C39 family peptidase [Anaerolineaceae bacterium]